MKNLFIIGALFLIVASFAIAAEKEQKDTAATGNGTNMTYGQCVSQAAEAKNGCFDTVKSARDACVDAAKNESKDGKQCKADYKKGSKQCKATFKASKQECAQNYKPGFFEKMRYAFK